MPVDVDRHDRARAGCDFFFDLRHIYAPGFGVAVDEDRNAVAVGYCQGARDDRKGRDDDFVTGLEFEAPDSHLQRCSSIADGDSVLPATVRCPFLLEFIDKPA
jgi:hypothetical protein